MSLLLIFEYEKQIENSGQSSETRRGIIRGIIVSA